MKKLSKVLAVAGVASVVASNAYAAGDAGNALDKIALKAASMFAGVRKIVFVVGGFGLIGLAMAAIFGKIQWKWFGALAVGLAILALASTVVTYVAGDKAGEQFSGDAVDTWND